MAWEVQGASDCEVHFKNGNFVSRVFPGVLTVSLLAVEGLPSFAVGGTAKRPPIETSVFIPFALMSRCIVVSFMRSLL